MSRYDSNITASYVHQGVHYGNVTINGEQTRDHGKIAEINFEARRYRVAAHACREELYENPADPALNFLMALCLLSGRRPHAHEIDTIRAIEGHLVSARRLSSARALLLLVREDHELLWRRIDVLPAEAEAVIALVDPASAKRITEHVPAPEARVWRALLARQRG